MIGHVDIGPVFSYKLRYIAGSGLVEMTIGSLRVQSCRHLHLMFINKPHFISVSHWIAVTDHLLKPLLIHTSQMVNPFSAGTAFIRQNLPSIDGRF